MSFLFNCVGNFNKFTGKFKFEESKWQIPIAAIKQVSIHQTGKKMEMKLSIDIVR
jgi:hypothetical protein